MTTAEVATLLRTPVETVRYWRQVHKGPPSYKFGRQVRYDVDEVDEWINQQRKNADQDCCAPLSASFGDGKTGLAMLLCERSAGHEGEHMHLLRWTS